VPVGGSTGQILAKNSATNYDTEWIDPPAGGSVAWADVTGKPTFATIATSASAADLTAGILPAARFDDTAHGSRAGGTLHAAVVAGGASGFMTGADKTKLDGIATGAQVNVATDLSYTAASRLLASSTGADVTLPLVGSDAGLMSAADKTKLDGVATGATANSADATLLARANHTGTQLAATISDFASAVAATAAVTANTAKVSNATHTGDVTGSTALTIAANVVDNTKLSDMAANTVKARAASTSGDPSDVALAASQLLGRGASGDIAAITLGTNLSMSGTTLNATGGGGTTISVGTTAPGSPSVGDLWVDTN
jgi:hypothetical protein